MGLTPINPEELIIKDENLEKAAESISDFFEGNPPVIVIVGGHGDEYDAKTPKRIKYGFYKTKRLRDRVGLLQTTIQYDVFKHEWNATVKNNLRNRARWFFIDT
jgi:hypothetical protein